MGVKTAGTCVRTGCCCGAVPSAARPIAGAVKRGRGSVRIEGAGPAGAVNLGHHY